MAKAHAEWNQPIIGEFRAREAWSRRAGTDVDIEAPGEGTVPGPVDALEQILTAHPH